MRDAVKASLPLRWDKAHYGHPFRKNHRVQPNRSVKYSFNKTATFFKIQAHKHILVAKTFKIYFFNTGKIEFYIALLGELEIPSFINLLCHFEGRNNKGYQRPITRMRLKGHFCDFRIMKLWPVSKMLNDDFGVGYLGNSGIMIL